MTYNQFYYSINLRHLSENRDMETYLLALLRLVEQEREQTLTADLLLKLLHAACISEPQKFDNNWLKIVTAPDEEEVCKKMNNKANSSLEDTGIYYTIAVLQFQIAELHKMKGKQLNDESQSFGIDSETANRWYNFDPYSILECGMRCYLDYCEDDKQEFEVSWQTLGSLLEMGRIYE